MKTIKLSLGDQSIAAKAIEILFSLDDKVDHSQKKEMTADERLLHKACEKYLKSKEVLDKEGNVPYAEFPARVMKAIEKFM